MRGAVIARM